MNKNKSNSTIAILLATRNGELYIDEQLSSLMCQSHQDFHIYIHDDGSSDQTISKLEKWLSDYPDKITIIDGVATDSARDNFFYLMRAVDADYYMFCDQDDVWNDSKLAKTTKKMMSLEDKHQKKIPTGGTGAEEIPLLVFSDLQVVDSELVTLHYRMSEYQCLNPARIGFNQLLVKNVITGCTIMINRALRDKALLVANTEEILMHDWWCALIAARYGHIGYIDEPLVKYRQHANNTVGSKPGKGIKYITNKVRSLDDINTSLELTRRQAGAFARTYGDSLALSYASIKKERKLNRIKFYIKEGTTKGDIIKDMGLFILG